MEYTVNRRFKHISATQYSALCKVYCTPALLSQCRTLYVWRGVVNNSFACSVVDINTSQRSTFLWWMYDVRWSTTTKSSLFSLRLLSCGLVCLLYGCALVWNNILCVRRHSMYRTVMLCKTTFVRMLGTKHYKRDEGDEGRRVVWLFIFFRFGKSFFTAQWRL